MKLLGKYANIRPFRQYKMDYNDETIKLDQISDMYVDVVEYS